MPCSLYATKAKSPYDVEARERQVFHYQLPSGESPARDYRGSIRDENLKAAVDARVARFRGGNFGDSKSLGKGVFESRIDYGPGYRIYYGVDGDEIILLLISDKGNQSADIKLAHGYWDDFKKRKKEQQEKEGREKRNADKNKLPRRSLKRSKK